MEQTRKNDDARKNTRDETPKKGGFKKTTTLFRLRKIDHRKFWIFLGKTDTEMKKKKGKEEVRKEKWDQEQKREKKKWGRTKRRYTKTAMEKKG